MAYRWRESSTTTEQTACILIVDDDDSQRLLTHYALERWGYTAQEAESGHVALTHLRTSPPDLILLDGRMPEMDGFETCRKIREVAEWDPIPILMMTSLSGPEQELKAMEAGAQDFLEKSLNPLDNVALRARVANLVRIKALYDGLAQRNTELQTVLGKYESMAAALAERASLAALDADISQVLTHEASLPEILQRCAQAIIRHLDVGLAAVWLLDRAGQVLELTAHAGLETGLSQFHSRVPVGESPIGLIAHTRQLYLSNTMQEDGIFAGQEWCDRKDLGAFVGYPLIIDQQLLGVMAMIAGQPISAVLVDAFAATADAVALGIERKQVATSVQQSEEYFRALTENASDIITILDSDGSLRYTSVAVERILGYTPDSILGKSLFGLVHPDDQSYLVDEFSRTTQNPGRSLPLEFRCERFDGSWCVLEGTGKSLIDTPAVAGVVINLRDITERKQVEEALEQQREWLEVTLSSIGDAVIATDTAGKILFLNPVAAKLTGWAAEDAWGRDIEQVFQVCDAQTHHTIASPIWHALNGVIGLPERTLLKTGDGRVVPVDESCAPIRNTTGQLQGAVLVFRDVTERQQAAEALRLSQERYRDLVESAQGLICTHTLEGILLSVNHAGAQAFGYRPEEMIGRSLSAFLQPTAQAQFPAYLQQIRQEPTVRGLLHGRVKSGQECVLAFHNSRRAEPGQEPYVLGHALDVTERVKVEEQLRESEARKGAILEAALDCIITIDHTGTILEFNPAAEQTFGYTRTEALGRSVASLIIPAALQEAHSTGLAHYLATGEGRVLGKRIEITARHANGTEFPVELAVTPVQVGEYPIFTAYLRDITERKQAEEALRESIDIGFKIQQTLLLGQPPQGLPQVQLAASTTPSQRIDGDFYDFFKHGEQSLDIVVGDVMGKGVPAALLGAATKSHLMRAMSELLCVPPHTIPTPQQILSAVHADMIRQLIELESFITLCYVRFDLEQQEVGLVDCGHTRTIHFEAEAGHCQFLAGDNLPLGCLEEEVYKEVVFPFAIGDVFVLYSDGLTEARGPTGDFFGEERLSAVVEAHGHLPPEELIEQIHHAVSAFSAADTFSDDLTCVVVKILRPEDGLSMRRITTEIPSTLSQLAQARLFVREFCRALPVPGMDAEDRSQFELAVTEAASNIMQHAYRGQSDKTISLEAEASAEQIRIRLSHWGEAFDPISVSPPRFDEDAEGGWGVFIIENCVDKVTYTSDEDGKHSVCLCKDRRLANV